MKFKIFSLLILIPFFFSGCSPKDNSLMNISDGKLEEVIFNDDIESNYRVYMLASSAGFNGTYEEWLASIKGLKGDKGITGDKGPTGDSGNKGSTGVNGSTIFKGSGAPSSSLGSNGDFYVNTSNLDFYAKSSNSWSVKVNLSSSGTQNSKYVSYLEIANKGSIRKEYVGAGTLSCSAVIKAQSGMDDVIWFCSNPGLVNFTQSGKNASFNIKPVRGNTSVIIGVKAKYDLTYFDTFRVDLYPASIASYSRADGSIISSELNNDGKVVVTGNGSSAVGFSGIGNNDDIWYVEATITVDSFLDDNYPKIGIMTGSNPGYDSNDCLWWMIDAQKSRKDTCWNYMAPICKVNGEWRWDVDYVAGSHAGNDISKYRIGNKMRIGLLKYYHNYFAYSDIVGSYAPVLSFSHPSLLSNSQAWIYCFNLNYTVNHMITKIGSEAVQMCLGRANKLETQNIGQVNAGTITAPKTKLSIGDYSRKYAEPIYSTFDYSLLTFKSSNTNVAEVNFKGEVTAKNAGNATITISYPGLPSVNSTISVVNEFPRSYKGTGWNSNVASKQVDLSRSFTATYNGTLISPSSEFGQGLIAEIIEEGKSSTENGGLTLRNDWFKWSGNWGNHSAYADNWNGLAKRNCDFEVKFIWNKDTSTLVVTMYTNSKSGDGNNLTTHNITNIGYRGIAYVKVGVTDSGQEQTINVNSFSLS